MVFNLVIGLSIGGLGAFLAIGLGYRGGPLGCYGAALWWMYCVASISIVIAIELLPEKFKFRFMLRRRKVENEVLNVNQLYKEGILSQSEFEVRIKELKDKACY